jgi:TolB-like protein/class 3 adenylate cyclase/Tfp pilus assembly protein PilF
MSGASSPPPAAETRKLAAIMFTDIAGFSRQMGANEARTLRLLEVHNQLVQQAVAAQHGHVIKTIGDAFLVDFPSVVNAVQCAQQIQHQLRTYNAEHPGEEQIHLRIGIHLGDIVQKDSDVFGDGVNIASRLQALAEPDTICFSQKVYEEVAKKIDLGAVVSLGQPKLKNIAERFQVYALLLEAPNGFRQKFQVQRLKLFRRVRSAHQLLAAGLLLIAVTLITVRYFPIFLPSAQPPTSGTQAALPLPDKPSIAVLPFTNMSNDPEQDYFSDGITEDITSSLSRISSLFVIARNSAFTYKGKAVKVQDVSREMGVRYVLEGSVRKAGEQVRITAQLINATTGEHLWSERFDRPFKDIFALQDEIVQRIVTTLKLQITLTEQGFIVRKTTDNLEAYNYWLRGVESSWRLTKESTAQARQMYEKALELDPNYAQAYAGASVTHLTDWSSQWSQNLQQSLDQAFALAQRAIALDDSSPAAHSILGIVLLWKKQHDQAIAEGARAIALDPNFADAYAWLGFTLGSAGQPEEALKAVEKAIRLNPRYPSLYLMISGRAHILAGQYEKGIADLKIALARLPNLIPARYILAVAYSELGQEEAARSEVAELQRISPSFSLEGLRQRAPFKDSAVLERHLNALRKAGLK